MIEFDWAVPTSKVGTVADTLGRILGFLFYEWEVIDVARGSVLVRFGVTDRNVAAQIISRLRAA